MGVLKFLHDRSTEVLTATYFKHYPLYPNESEIKFSYEIVNDRDSQYSTLLDGLHGTLRMMTIKTDDRLECKDREYIRTQDGEFWQITGVIEAPSTDNNKQALRRRIRTIQTRTIIRLIGVKNPRDDKSAF